MKPQLLKVKGSAYNSGGKKYIKKYITPGQRKLPDVNSQVLLCSPELLNAFEILNSTFLELIKTRNPTILREIQKHITPDQARFLSEVAKDVLG